MNNYSFDFAGLPSCNLAKRRYNSRMSTTTAVLTTTHQINALRAHTLRIGLQTEIQHNMRLTGKAPSCYSIVKRELGFKGSKVKVYAQYLLWMEQNGLIVLDKPTFNAAMSLATGGKRK